MEKIHSSVGDVVSPGAPTAPSPASIELSYDDLKEISKAFSRVNKALDKEKKRLGSGSYVFHKKRIVGEQIDGLTSSGDKLAGLAVACYKNECRDPEQPLVTFYALNGKKVRSRLETWIPKLFTIES